MDLSSSRLHNPGDCFAYVYYKHLSKKELIMVIKIDVCPYWNSWQHMLMFVELALRIILK